MKNFTVWMGTSLLLSAVFFGLLAGCSTGSTSTPAPAPPPPEPPGKTSTALAYPMTVTDQLGRTVRLEAAPQRIISMAPSNTEIVFALGLADRLVAVTDFCDYPPEAEDKPSIGGFSTPNIEEIVANGPDLVLATQRHEDKIIAELENKGLTVLALDPKTVDEVIEAIELMGAATGEEEKAQALADDMRGRIKAVTDKTSILTSEQRPKTFYVLWHDPLMTTGTYTLQDELIRKAGGVNIAAEVDEYADINLEAVVAADPDVIIAGTSHGSAEEQTFLYIKEETRLRDTGAVRNDRIFAVDGNLTSRPGPRIVDGLEWMAHFIHPEMFGPPGG
jgi:iron complex transport system substrate-binding protein